MTEKSMTDLLGIEFKEDGSWNAQDVGNAKMFTRLNHAQRRKIKLDARREERRAKRKKTK